MSSDQTTAPDSIRNKPIFELKRHVMLEYDADIIDTGFQTVIQLGDSSGVLFKKSALERLGLITPDADLVNDDHQVQAAVFDNGLVVMDLQPPTQ